MSPREEEEQHCAITNPGEYVGFVLVILGWMVAGALIIVQGSMIAPSSPDLTGAEIVGGVAAGLLILALIGHYLTTPDVLCTSSERGLHYFGNMFVLIGFVGLAGFTLGSAIGLTSGPNDTMMADDVAAYSYLCGVFLLIFAIGWLICHATTSMSCDEAVLASTVGHYLVVIFIIVAGGLYFGVGALLGDGNNSDGAILLYVVGACYIMVSVGLMCVNCQLCC